MSLPFTLGIEQLQSELTLMQPPACYWITSDRLADARTLARQVIGAQQQITLITSIDTPQALLNPEPPGEVMNIPMFSLPVGRKALLDLPEDLARVLSARPRLILFYCAYTCWQMLTSREILNWLKKTHRLLAEKQTAMLIITSGAGINNLRSQLQTFFRYLDGVAHLEWQQDSWDYRINWWCHDNQLLAERTLRFSKNDERYGLLKDDEPATPLTLNDEHHFIAQRDVLEGAPPLSRQWQLFDSNDRVWSCAQQASSATVIFNLDNNQQIIPLAESIHHLRRSRGSALKIVVRELQTSMRHSDERLLLACGVNIVVPADTRLSHFLTMLEGIQGQSYNRHVPADLEQLVATMQPLNLKGFLAPERFCNAVQQLLSNTQLPENGKGLLVALRPSPQLRAQQALTLCKTRRYGDLVTLIDDRLYLFLFSCRFNDLDTALKSVFPLPYEEIFVNRMIWYEDVQMLSEIRQIRALHPSDWHQDDDENETRAEATPARQRYTPRHVPQAITLTASQHEVNRR